MEIHAILGGVLFVAAIVSVVVVVFMTTAAARSPEKKSSSRITGRLFGVSAGGLSLKQGSLEAGQCYWDCLSGFHWAEDWEKHCASACALTEKPGVA